MREHLLFLNTRYYDPVSRSSHQREKEGRDLYSRVHRLVDIVWMGMYLAELAFPNFLGYGPLPSQGVKGPCLGPLAQRPGNIYTQETFVLKTCLVSRVSFLPASPLRTGKLHLDEPRPWKFGMLLCVSERDGHEMKEGRKI